MEGLHRDVLRCKYSLAGNILIVRVICAAAYNTLTREDPFDQELNAALGPLLQPLNTLLSRTPASSNLIAGVLGTDSPVVRLSITTTLMLVLKPWPYNMPMPCPHRSNADADLRLPG